MVVGRKPIKVKGHNWPKSAGHRVKKKKKTWIKKKKKLTTHRKTLKNRDQIRKIQAQYICKCTKGQLGEADQMITDPPPQSNAKPKGQTKNMVVQWHKVSCW